MVGVPNWGYVTGRFLLGICRMVKGIHTHWNHAWEHLDDDEKEHLSEVDMNSVSTKNEGKAVNIFESGLLMSLAIGSWT